MKIITKSYFYLLIFQDFRNSYVFISSSKKKRSYRLAIRLWINKSMVMRKRKKATKSVYDENSDICFSCYFVRNILSFPLSFCLARNREERNPGEGILHREVHAASPAIPKEFKSVSQHLKDLFRILFRLLLLI